jgi:hypothetical protein
MKRWFTYKHEQSPAHNLNRLRLHLNKASQSTMMQLGNWLGEEVKVTGTPDAENLCFTMTFVHERLDTLGQADLIFKGARAVPVGVRTRVHTVCWGASDESEDVEERRTMMEKIHKKALNLFILRSRWRIFYYRGEELLHSWTMIDDNMTRVKSTAYRESPPEADMIKLVTPKGKALIRTEKKQWTHEG